MGRSTRVTPEELILQLEEKLAEMQAQIDALKAAIDSLLGENT